MKEAIKKQQNELKNFLNTLRLKKQRKMHL